MTVRGRRVTDLSIYTSFGTIANHTYRHKNLSDLTGNAGNRRNLSDGFLHAAQARVARWRQQLSPPPGPPKYIYIRVYRTGGIKGAFFALPALYV